LRSRDLESLYLSPAARRVVIGRAAGDATS
jgi:hypothetical protein